MKLLSEILGISTLMTLSLCTPTRFDNINIDEILNNQMLYRKYYECFANIGKCTADLRKLKELLPEALASDCGKCDENQKQIVEKVLKYIIQNRPGDFSVLEKIYDPDGDYRKKFASEVEKRGILFHHML